jgi:hypothetical protein
MARHNREARGLDQHGVEYVISYQPDWLHQVKVTRRLPQSRRQSTKTLFRNQASYAQRKPGDKIRTRVTSKELGLDVEVAVADPARQVTQLILSTRAQRSGEEVAFVIDGRLPTKDEGPLMKRRRVRRSNA